MLKIDRVRELVASFRGKHVVVLGDVMLDETVRGDVSRISPEAPVPVVDLRDRLLAPGGAANAAANVVSLGGRATIVGLVGRDAHADILREHIAARGIDTSGLVVCDGRPTTHKMRVVARTQQIVRVDVESREPVPASSENDLLGVVDDLATCAHAVLVSDYAKGVVSDAVSRGAIERATQRKLPVVVDPKQRDFTKYAGATLVTPNVHELDIAANTSTENVDGAVVAAARSLLGQLGGAALLVTRGASGMTLLEQGAEPFHMATVARSVFDVTGAGDTVAAAIALSLAAGISIPDAMALATHAAGIAVSRVGTAAVRAEELVDSFRP
jgi:D-beta-D-heptose 7-phosphate kinase/D-beta-D-heptose 1-phosphate adenosyltransferase